MFHLEDYLEKLEPLPQEIKDRLEKIGEIDLQVEQSMEDVKKNVDCLFSKADQLDPKDLEQNFNTIMENGEKAVEQSENKIQMASSMQALLEKYIKRLNIDILNFQVDLKEQYGDVTRDIDKKILKEDDETTENQNYQLNKCLFGGDQGAGFSSNEELNVISNSSPEFVKSNHSLQEFKTINSNKDINSGKESSISGSLEISISNEKIVESDVIKQSNTKKNNKQNKSADAPLIIKKKSKAKEVRYCLCNEVAYDRMVACDNKACPYEWFHFGCVGLSRQPQGKWYCTLCAKKMKKRQRR